MVSESITIAFDGSFGDKLLRSLEYLGFKARSHNAIHACESVSRVLAEQKKYALFKEMFPNEWGVSKTSFYRAGRYKLYSERVCELFDLVNERCFPLLDHWNDDSEFEFERFAIMPLNFDLCCEDIDYDALRCSYVAGLIFYAYDTEIWDHFFEQYGVSKDDLPPIRREPHRSVWRKKQSAKTKPYSMLIRMVDHSTGNPWLDMLHCQYSELFEWDKQTIEALTWDYREAIGSFKNLEKLDERFSENPKQFLTDLINFWNTGRIDRD